MIKIAYFSLDDLRFPSPMVRVIAPHELFQEDLALLSGSTIAAGQRTENPGALDEADIVLVQRGFPQRGTQAICDAILSCGKPVIYETDDALQLVPKHHNKPIYEEDIGPAVERFAQRADLVTVATPALGELFPRARQLRVLPNYLSPALWTDELAAAPRDPRRTRIGFVGSANHDRDFATLVPLLREALERYENLEVVSYGGISGGLEGHPRFSAIEAKYFYRKHPQRLAAAGIDIAVVPLTPSRFNRCKSNIKFLEFGFLGVPGVFAALEPYRDVVDGETGFLCDEQPAAWREALFALVEDSALRRRMGQAAREVVRGAWMLDRHKEKWLNAYGLAARARAGGGHKTKAKGKVSR
jgi:glycosyltransferase involved in cell wall biosynthesis